MPTSQAATAAQPTVPDVIAFGPAGGLSRPFAFDRRSGLLMREGVEVPLPPRVVSVLGLLIERPGQLVLKQELIASVWRDAYVTETSLAEAVSVLRQALGDDRQQPTYVQTLHRRGYRLIADVGRRGAVPELTPLVGDVTTPSGPRHSTGLSTRVQHSGLLPAVPWVVALFAILIAIVALWKLSHAVPVQSRSPVRFSIAPPDGVRLSTSPDAVAISPDGSLIAFAACRADDCRIYLRPLGDATATPLAGTTRGSSPFFSPDARTLGFFADGKVMTLPLTGGAVAAVADATGSFGAAWLRDGRIIYAGDARGGLRILSPLSGSSAELTRPAAGAGHWWPSATPDESAVVFTASESSDGARPYAAVYVFRGSAWHRLLDDADAVRAVAPGYLVARRGGKSIAAPFDRASMSLLSLPVVLDESEPGSAATGPRYAVSASGHLVRLDSAAGVLQVTLDWSADLRRLVPFPTPAAPR